MTIDPSVADISPYVPTSNRHQPILSIGENYVPASFPLQKFAERQQIYATYLNAFSGGFLKDEDTSYPLEINSFRNFAERIGFVLVGEADENSEPAVRSVISPKMIDFLGEERGDIEKGCRLAEQLVSQVWKQSAGRAKQLEAGIVAQYMGGVVMQLLWRDDRPDLLLPFQVKLLSPDLFMPVFDGDDYWNLLEGFVIHKITWQEAKIKYNITDAHEGGEYIYIEHWTKEKFTITINGVPIRHEMGYLIKDIEHPFGEVPLYYIPAIRVNDYYGISIVDRIEKLAREYNARMADNGDAIYKNINPNVWTSGTTQPAQLRQIKDTANKVVREYYDVGEGSALNKNAKPEVFFEEPPALSDSTLRYVNNVWVEMLRQIGLSNVAFGEDEGSQRSGLTLAFRMWPVTSLTRAQRMHFEVGYSKIAMAIVRAFINRRESTAIKAFFEIYPQAPEFVDNFEKRIDIAQDWAPQIPRDRDQMVQEIVTLVAADLIPQVEAMQRLGAKDPKQWQQMILEEKREQMQLQIEMMPSPVEGGDPASSDVSSDEEAKNKQLPNLKTKPKVDLEAGQNKVAPVSQDERE